MDRIVITIRPSVSDEGLLDVSDAMQQVLDSVKLFKDAQNALGSPHERFDWKLERASTNSPFTVVAVARPVNPSVDISAAVRRVKSDVSSGIRNLLAHGTPPGWMSRDSYYVAKNIFSRNLNGISETDIDFEDGNVLAINRDQAVVGFNAIAALNIMDLEQEIPARVSFGEIEGVMVSVGRFRNKPAIQIRTDLYGFVWCTLGSQIVNQFGDTHSMSDVWAGKTLGIRGRLNYESGGHLKTIEVLQIREIQSAPLVDLEALLDPDFTGGMDPHEYLEKLHEGRLS